MIFANSPVTVSMSEREVSSERLRVAVALQGGGSHGAFTWGVLDRLLLEPALEIVGISGTSAGAMNAAILADGLRRGGRSEAKAALASYWEDIGDLPGYASFEALPVPGAPRFWHLDNNPMFLWMDMMARVWSPYQTNPFNCNPLRALLERIDFEELRHDQDAPRVFIGATNVRSGLRRVFDNGELSADVLLASACLPLAYQAVEIGGEHYWDGGYTGNPPLAPLYLRTTATDVVVIGINPLLRADVPKTAREGSGFKPRIRLPVMEPRLRYTGGTRCKDFDLDMVRAGSKAPFRKSADYSGLRRQADYLRPNSDFALGSKTALTAPKSDFRFTPDSGLKSDMAPGLKRPCVDVKV